MANREINSSHRKAIHHIERPRSCVSRVVASSSKPDHFDIKVEVCGSRSTPRTKSREDDPARGRRSPRTERGRLRGAHHTYPPQVTGLAKSDVSSLHAGPFE
ncbi:hypothetical protein EYF80_015184 [Liparis tanakae]|uniref:Uncharacterized protein n=1 Tax=Liparis tanakae TaxID=230148 RepID=A0A4Z2I9M0_9TELE|nr:hypothetical protein EYF80_015184 [Liparis tanakae]